MDEEARDRIEALESHVGDLHRALSKLLNVLAWEHRGIWPQRAEAIRSEYELERRLS